MSSKQEAADCFIAVEAYSISRVWCFELRKRQKHPHKPKYSDFLCRWISSVIDLILLEYLRTH